MARPLLSPQLSLALACLGLYVATAAQVRSSQGTALSLAVHSLSQPLVAATSYALQTLGDWRAGRQDWQRTLGELQRLRQQVDDLQRENHLLVSELLTLRQGHALLQTLPSLRDRAVLARVVARDRLGSHSLLLDRGRKHGLSTDCPVLAADGVLGRVEHVWDETARVQLLSHPAAAAAAQVVGVEGEVLLLGGENPRLEGFPPYTQVPVGSPVVTTGSEGIYPPGLPLAVTGEPQLGRVFTLVPVTLAARPEKAQVVLVLRRESP